MRIRQTSSFTLVELLTVVAIMGALIAGAIFFVPSYVQWAKNTTDKEIYTVLNDEIARYKSEGGNVNALTMGAPFNDVFAALQTPVTPAGMPSTFTHQFMPTNYTYPGRSLSALGNAGQYHIARTGTYTAPDFSGWYNVTNTGGSTGTIVVNMKFVIVSANPPYYDSMNVFAIRNGTPYLNVGGGSGAWPTNSNMATEAAKTWYPGNATIQGATPTTYPNGYVYAFTISSLPPGNYTLQYWDVLDGSPPSGMTWPWELPPCASPTIPISAGQTVTINAHYYYDNTRFSDPATFYGGWSTWN